MSVEGCNKVVPSRRLRQKTQELLRELVGGSSLGEGQGASAIQAVALFLSYLHFASPGMDPLKGQRPRCTSPIPSFSLQTVCWEALPT